MSPIMVLPQQYHMDISSWLGLLDLPQYKGICFSSFFAIKILRTVNHSISFRKTESFSKFIGVEELLYLCEADIKQLGVRNSAHRARIVSSLVALRDKYERGMYK